MKLIKIIFIASFLFTTSTLFAQPESMGRKTAEQRTEIITKNLTEKLVLSESQTEEIRELLLKREKLRDAGKLSKDHQKKIKADIHKILTREQREQWKNMKKENP